MNAPRRHISGPARRVILLDDDVARRHEVRQALVSGGFAVQEVDDVEGALRSADDADLIILDMATSVPDVRRQVEIPMIVVADRGMESRAVDALNLGATDDFVRAPLFPAEVVARARALLRQRAASSRGRVIVADELEIDPSARTVRLGGRAVALTKREFDLLAYLAERPGVTQSVASLLERVWESSAEWQDRHTVSEHVRRLRHKIGSEWIETVRGVGYRFERRHRS